MSGNVRSVLLGVGVTVIVWTSIFLFATHFPGHGTVSRASRQGATVEQTAAVQAPVDTREHVSHVDLPEQVKAIYMTACVAGSPSFREQLVNLIRTTELNALVIDIKDYSGTISFNPGSESEWYPAWQNARCGARDMKRFVASLHEEGVYVIGRITLFQDPFYTERHPEDAVKRADRTTVWTDKKGLAFVDIGAKRFWDRVSDLATSAHNLGFDELNFDYARYPSDGDMSDISYPQAEASIHGVDKAANLEAFFSYLQTALNDPTRYLSVIHDWDRATPWTSVDLFGMTTTAMNDMNIGQVLERAMPYFDFVAPMVYPSHYPAGFIGMADPDTDPYRLVSYAMNEGVRRTEATTTPIAGLTHARIGTSTPAVYAKVSFPASKLRTWIQDFNYGGTYGPKEVRDEIQASYDSGVNDWMIWSPSNKYTIGALQKPTSTVSLLR